MRSSFEHNAHFYREMGVHRVPDLQAWHRSGGGTDVLMLQGLPADDDLSALRQRSRELLEENAALLERTVQLQKAASAPQQV